MRVRSFCGKEGHVPQELKMLMERHFTNVEVSHHGESWEETVLSLEECCRDAHFCQDGDILAELEDASSELAGVIRAGDSVIVPVRGVSDFLIRVALIETVSMVEADPDLKEQFSEVTVWGFVKGDLTKLYPK